MSTKKLRHIYIFSKKPRFIPDVKMNNLVLEDVS
jgi:hypothetical protein